MNKELIDRAWACLPREFKEEVKKEYYHDDSNPFELAQLEAIFGIHNLTSDVEGEDCHAAYKYCWADDDVLVGKRSSCPIEACVQLIEWLKENNYKLNEI